MGWRIKCEKLLWQSHSQDEDPPEVRVVPLQGLKTGKNKYCWALEQMCITKAVSPVSLAAKSQNTQKKLSNKHSAVAQWHGHLFSHQPTYTQKSEARISPHLELDMSLTSLIKPSNRPPVWLVNFFAVRGRVFRQGLPCRSSCLNSIWGPLPLLLECWD